MHCAGNYLVTDLVGSVTEPSCFLYGQINHFGNRDLFPTFRWLTEGFSCYVWMIKTRLIQSACSETCFAVITVLLIGSLNLVLAFFFIPNYLCRAFFDTNWCFFFSWFDKSFSLIVDKAGVSAMNFEHSWGDGVAILRLMEEIKADSEKNHFVSPDTEPIPEKCAHFRKLGSVGFDYN